MNTQFIRKLTMASVATVMLVLSTRDVLADSLDHWTTNVISANQFHLNRVIYQSGRYVGVGGDTMFPDFGFTAVSTNGVNWTVGTHGFDFGGNSIFELFGLASSGGGFAAVGRFGYVYWSTNGLNWTQGGTGPDYIYIDIAASPSMYVAVAQTNVVMFPGGISWNVILDDELLSSIAYGVDRFVVVGRNGFETFAFVSTNWWDWNRYTVSNPGGPGIPAFEPSVCFGKTFFIVPWSSNVNKISTNGVSWLSITNDSGVAFRKIRYGNGIYIGWSADTVYTSMNGTNWIKRPPSGGSLTDAAVGERNAIVTSYSFGAAANSYVSDPFIGLSILPGESPQLQLSGVIGKSYRVEYSDALTPSSPTNWQTLSNIVLTVSPFTLLDPETTGVPMRFYRGVLLP